MLEQYVTERRSHKVQLRIAGWSTGFITTPRTDGRTPNQRLRPAFP
jgi:hypothetical protein